MLRGPQLDEFHRACWEQAQIHPQEGMRERLVRWARAPCVNDEAATLMSPFVLRSRLLHALQSRALKDCTLTEQAGALEFVMGALRIYPYPPSGRWLQHAIVHANGEPLLPEVEALRVQLAALPADAFVRVLQEMLNPLRGVEPRHPSLW
jgi:hypothetical protein